MGWQDAPIVEQAAEKEQASPTLNTASRIGRAFLQAGPLGAAAEGVGAAMRGIDAGAYDLGGAVTDATGSPELGFATNVAVQSIPALAGGQVSKAAASPAIEATAKRTMQSALKPSANSIVTGDAGKAIDTMLKEGINVSTGGAAKLRKMIGELNSEIAEKISKSNAVVDKSAVMSEVYKTLQKFRNQFNSSADEAAILKSWAETSNKLEALVPVQKLQSLKQGTYKILADKYAKGGTPAIENEAATQAQMAAARGARIGLEEAVPGVGQLNAKESALINALELAERRAGVAGNKDIAGLAWLANNPAAATAFLAGRSELFKSIVARMMYASRNRLPQAAGGGAMTAYQAGTQNEQP